MTRLLVAVESSEKRKGEGTWRLMKEKKERKSVGKLLTSWTKLTLRFFY